MGARKWTSGVTMWKPQERKVTCYRCGTVVDESQSCTMGNLDYNQSREFCSHRCACAAYADRYKTRDIRHYEEAHSPERFAN